MRYLAVAVFAALILGGVFTAHTARSADEVVLAPGAWMIDPVHSAIVWRVEHFGGIGHVYGRFNSFSGTVNIDPQQPDNSSVEVTVDVSSIDTAVAARDEHLRTPDFFDVAQYPELTFKSTAVTPVAGMAGAYDVTGELTLLAITKTITVRMQHDGVIVDQKGGQVTSFTGEFSVRRSDYGMKGDDMVDIMLAFECRPVQPTEPSA